MTTPDFFQYTRDLAHYIKARLLSLQRTTVPRPAPPAVLHHAPLIPAGMNPFHWNPPESAGMAQESTGMGRNGQEWNRNGQEWHRNGTGMH